MIRTVPLDAPHEVIIKTWLENLRDPENKQGKRALKLSDGSMCCLGVLCATVGVEPHGGNLIEYRSIREAAHIDSNGSYDEESLTYDNDHGKTFAEIADLIESRPSGLFKEPV